MRLSPGSPALSATFDDPNLVSVGGLAPVLALAQSGGLAELVADKLTGTVRVIAGIHTFPLVGWVRTSKGRRPCLAAVYR
jgi:hypothetical protein